MNDHSETSHVCADPSMSAMLADYFMGNLSARDAERFEEHFVACNKCRAEYEELEPLLVMMRDHRSEVLEELAEIRARETAIAPKTVVRPKATQSVWTVFKEKIDRFFAARFLIPAVAVAAAGVILLRSNYTPTEPVSPPVADKPVEKLLTDTSAVVPEVEPVRPEVKTKIVEKKQSTATETKKDTTGTVKVNPVVPTPSRTERVLPGTVPSDLFDNTPMALRTERPTSPPPSQGGNIAVPTNPTDVENPTLASATERPGQGGGIPDANLTPASATPGGGTPATGISSAKEGSILIVPDITSVDRAIKGGLSAEFLMGLSDGLRQRLQASTGFTVSKTPQVPVAGGNSMTTSRILVRTSIKAAEGTKDEVLLEIVMTDAITGKLLDTKTVRGRAEDLPALVANTFKKK